MPLTSQRVSCSFGAALLTLSFAAGVRADALSVTCALPYTNGKPGSDCNGKHLIEVDVQGGQGAATVDVQVLALNVDGNQLGSLPASDGDQVHFNSSTDPLDFRLRTASNGVHQVTAPIPVVSVVATEGDETARAYCSNVPFLDLVQPNGQVINEGDSIDAVIAFPGIDLSTLAVYVDGVDVIDGLGLTPGTDFPGGPYAGSVDINGTLVDVEGLTVDLGGIETSASNTLVMTLVGLPAGGHIVYVEGDLDSGWFKKEVGGNCHLDDMTDVGQFSIFGVDVFSPEPQEVTDEVPTPVVGEARHGRDITELKINGFQADLSGLVFTPGDGVSVADQYHLPFSELIPQTDLRSDLDTGTAPLGTFDRGSNRLTVDALDDLGNRAFEELFFAVGDVGAPSPGPEAFAKAVEASLHEALKPAISEATLDAENRIENSFVVGLTEDAIQTLMDQRCPEAGIAFQESVEAKIAEIDPIVKNVSGGCSCDPNVTISVDGATIDPTQIGCPITFENGQIAVEINLPDVIVHGSAFGECETEVLGVCVARTTVDMTSTTTISNLGLNFVITEGQFLGEEPEEPAFISGTSTVQTTGGSDVDCLADACNWAIEGLVTIFTFGTVDLDLTPTIDVSQVAEFNEAIGASEPDPISLGEIEVAEEPIEEFGQASLSGNLESVEITPDGFVASLSGCFETLAYDPDVEETPGAVIEIAPPPSVPIPGAGDATVLVSDDVVNQLFASMAESGGLKTDCSDTGKTIGDMLPADCDSLTGALASGYCHAIRGTDCETLTAPTLAVTAIKQGICHGASGHTCASIPAGAGPLGDAERDTCTNTPTTNLAAADSVLFCARQDNPPRYLLVDDAGTPDDVESAVRLSDLSISIIVDRDGDDTADLPNTPNCAGSASSLSGDCSLYGVCLDLNIVTLSSIAGEVEGCPTGVPGFINNVVDFQILNRQEGVVCGAPQETDDTGLVSTSNEDPTVDFIGENVHDFSPPLCMEGLTLGGFVTIADPRLIAVETDGDPDFQEYIGITGDIGAP